MNEATPKRPTIHEAILNQTRALRAAVAPISVLAARAMDPVQASPVEMLVETNRLILDSLGQLRESLDSLHARLDDPQVLKAIKDELRT